jgi:hypothetical protein
LFYIKNSGLTAKHTVTISSSPTFKSVAAIGNFGAIFYLYNVIYDDITSPTSYYNTTSSTGGGAFYLYGSTASIKDSSFKKMGAPLGGAFYMDSSVATISDSTFTLLNSTNSGGIIY